MTQCDRLNGVVTGVTRIAKKFDKYLNDVLVVIDWKYQDDSYLENLASVEEYLIFCFLINLPHLSEVSLKPFENTPFKKCMEMNSCKIGKIHANLTLAHRMCHDISLHTQWHAKRATMYPGSLHGTSYGPA